MAFRLQRHLEGMSFMVLAIVLGAIVYSQWHGSSLRATAVRAMARVSAHSEPQPFEAYVFIPVRFDKQDHALSCEVATLKMVLAQKGIFADESELIARVGFDNTPHTNDGGRDHWGNPTAAFVGNIDGRMMFDGYGVHYGPIAEVAKTYRSAEGFKGWYEWHLVQQLEAGNPVIIWGCLGPCQTRTWKTAGVEEPITAAVYEHTFVVNGFNGPPDDIQGFWLIDPIYGRRYMELDAFMEMWGVLGRTGVVVY